MSKRKSTITSRSLIVSAGCIILAILFSIKNDSEPTISLTNDGLDAIINQIDNAFDLAEEQVLDIKPEPDDVPNGPHPDVKKCICKGTGVITHGDGHTTDCPYHAKEVTSSGMDCTRPRRIFRFFR